MTIASYPNQISYKRERLRRPVLTFALALATLLAAFPSLGPALQYNRSLGPNDLYRILTCHWSHYSFSHLIWSLAAFVVLGSICEIQSRKKFIACLIISSIAIPVGLRYLAPSLISYRGLSGLDSALFFLASVPLIFQQDHSTRPTRMSFMLLPLLFLMKLLYEQLTGRAVFANTAGVFVPVPLAHLIGAMVGSAVALCPIRKRSSIAL